MSGMPPTQTEYNILSEVLELLALHLLSEPFFLALLLKYRVQEQNFIFLEGTKLVPCRIRGVNGLTHTRRPAPHLVYCVLPIPLVWLPSLHKFHGRRHKADPLLCSRRVSAEAFETVARTGTDSTHLSETSAVVGLLLGLRRRLLAQPACSVSCLSRAPDAA